MNVVDRELVQNYLQALESDEAEIQGAAEEYQRARARVDVSLLRYAALRDFLTSTLGCSPYASHIEWPDLGLIDPSRRGRFRFAGMRVGDAVVEVLGDRIDNFQKDQVFSEEWTPMHALTMSLEEIVEALSEGGLGFPDPVSVRAVNASLIRTAGIEDHVTPDGQKRYALGIGEEESETPPSEYDDLPFE